LDLRLIGALRPIAKACPEYVPGIGYGSTRGGFIAAVKPRSWPKRFGAKPLTHCSVTGYDRGDQLCALDASIMDIWGRLGTFSSISPGSAGR
jgi:hypothetical protein